MKRLLLLLFTLLTFGNSGVWADVTVTLVSSTQGDKQNTQPFEANNVTDTYGTRNTSSNPHKFTTKAKAGVAGLVLSAHQIDQAYWSEYYSLVIKPETKGTAYPMTITAPANYVITGYAFGCYGYGSSTYRIDTNATYSEGTSTEISTAVATPTQIEIENLEETTVTIWVNCTSTINWLVFTGFTVTLKPACTYGTAPGTFYNTSGQDQTSANSYATKWVSTATNPQVTISSYNSSGTAENDISCLGRPANTEGAYCLFANGGKTYTITVPNNYKITRYLIAGKSVTNAGAAGNDIAVTTTAGPTGTFTGSAVSEVEASSLDLRKTSITLTGTSAFLLPSKFYIYTEADNSFVANKSSISNAKSYMVHGVRGDWQYASADATSLGYTTTFDRTDDTRQIAFIKSENTGEYYAYSVITGKFIASDNTLSDTPTPIYIFETGNSDYPFFFSFMSDKSDNNINISSNTMTFSSWNTYDEGNRWCLYAAKDFDIPSSVSDAITEFETTNVTVTYKLKYNGNVIAEREVTQAVGSDAECPWTVPAYCVFGDCSPETIDEDTEDVEIVMTSSLPFSLSASYSNATWYYMTIRNTYYVIYDPSSENKTSTSSVTAKADAVATAERALWAFTGDPFNGIKVMNKAAGEDLYLNSSDSPLRMKASDNYSIWTLGENGTGFTLNNSGFYVNDVNRALGYWNDSRASTDEGSTMRIEAVDYYDLALAYLTQYATANAIENDEYFGVRPTDATSLSDQFSTAFSANHTLVTATLYEDRLKPAIEALIKLPETGYYRMKNVNETGYYLGYDGTADGAGATCLRGMQDNTSAKTIVHFVKDGENNSYQLSVEGTKIAAVSQGTKRTPSETAGNFITEYIAPGYAGFSTTLSGYTYLHCSNSQQYAIVGWETGKSSPASKWSIEKVTSIDLTLNAVGSFTYGTTYLPFDVTLPAESDVRAYTLKDLNNGWARPVLLGEDGKSIPAGTPVLLRGTSTTSVTATIESVDEIEIEENILDGTYVSKAHGNNLVLGKYDGVIGFYKYAFDINPNKAYIPADAEVKGFMLSWDETTVGVDDNISQQEQQKPTIYNISGQRVSQPTRGIYIVNGKKMVIK